MQIRTRQNAFVALAGIALVGLSGCSGSGAPTTDQSEEPSDATDTPKTPAASADYQDGDYTAEGGYISPGGPETVTVTLTLEDSTITAIDVTGSGSTPNAKKFQGEFIEGIDEIAVGKKIDELTVSKVAGSSLTSQGFTKALDQIKADAS